ncbi:MAG: diguanylate cyclase [Gammaproteobacteria bacterium]|nr:diguanylate cyclase [Gammaproteobacteria bacterium]
MPTIITRLMKHSLTREVLLQMALRITIVVIAVSALSYWHIISALREQTLDALANYITERGRKESAIFVLAQDNQTVFKQHFIEAYPRQEVVSDETFWSLFERRADGTVHLQDRAFDGYIRADGSRSHGTTAYIGPQAPVAQQEFRNRLHLAYQLVDRFSDAWTNRFANLYVSMPENVNIVHWPGLAWARNAPPTLDVTTEEWVTITTSANNPQRRPAWTGLYYDPTAEEWMVSCKTPIDIEGRHLLSVGHDILLNALFERVFKDHLHGAHNLILREDGRLIAHPEKVDELRQTLGLLDIADLDDAPLQGIYRTLQTTVFGHTATTHVIDDEQSDAYLAVSRITGPDWWFVTVYPKSLLTSNAAQTARFILLLGVLSLFIEMAMLYLVMRDKILRPLDLFRHALTRIDNGDYHAVAHGKTPLPDERDDEIGNIAQTLRSMATSIEHHSNRMASLTSDLERQVEERTAELQAAKNIAERLARVDELTAIANRRHFHEVATKELARARRDATPISLCIIDIDHFKQINDNHGHDIGDIVLRQTVQLLQQSIREVDFLARIGGEEFALLLPNTSLQESVVIVDRIRGIVATNQIATDKGTVRITISAGIAECHGQCEYEKLYANADQRLYDAKREGRNRTCY